MVTLTVDQKEGFSVVNIVLDESGVCVPNDLKTIEIPELKGNQGIIINGRAPVWVFAFLVHHFHAFQWVATNDPRLGGGVIIESHLKGVAVGDIIPLEGK
jgi:CRISPR-associated protein Csx3